MYGMEGPSNAVEEESCCCVIRFDSLELRARFIDDYHFKPWTDEKENLMDSRCFISPIKLLEVRLLLFYYSSKALLSTQRNIKLILEFYWIIKNILHRNNSESNHFFFADFRKDVMYFNSFAHSC